MNPLLLLALLYIADQKKAPNFRKYSLPPSYFDNLNLESLLDKLQNAVNALDKVNRLNQIAREPKALKAPSEDALELPAALGQVEQLAQIAQGLDIKSLAQNLGPILNMLGNYQGKQEK